MRKLFAAALLVAAFCWSVPAWAQGITVTASSTAASLFMGFSPDNLLDGDPNTAWAEGGEGVGAGEWVEFTFPEAVTMRRLRLRNGVQDPSWFEKYNRVKTLELVFPDGARRRVELADSRDEQVVDLGGARGSWLRLVIVDVYNCSVFFNSKTTCLSEAVIETSAPEHASEGPAAAALAQALAKGPETPGKGGKAAAAGGHDSGATAPVLKTEPAPARPKGKPSDARDGAELMTEFQRGGDAVVVIREYYRRLITLDDSFPQVFARQVREQEAFVFEMFREYQRKRKTYEKFRNALLDTDKLSMKFQAIDPDRVRVEVSGTYTIFVADTYEDVPENTVFVLLRDDGQWRILERQDGAAEPKK
ncbi:discoidin domain-containing protein [Desulfovibrio aminophilus]|nr:discoidin domain-containing protein [Desulfovibrio aminophilus]MCM0754997.1 discoidin domain-containing protein [Desulfovibrio aminophilus]